jgi:hypothetical protein
MTDLPKEYLQECLKMIEKLELGAQRGPKSLAAVKAEVSQTRQILDEIEESSLEDNSAIELCKRVANGN